MKNFSLVLAGALLCTLAAAKGIEKPASGSSVVITNPAGLFGVTIYSRSLTQHLYYFDDLYGNCHSASQLQMVEGGLD